MPITRPIRCAALLKPAPASATSSIIVVGAGVVGLSCALALQQRGWRVTICDPDRSGNAASWGNAGHLATEQVTPLASPAMLRSAPSRLAVWGGPLAFRNPLAIAPWVWRFLRSATKDRSEAGRRVLGGLMVQALPAWRRLADQLGQADLLQEHGHWMCWETGDSAVQGETRWRRSDTGTARIEPLAASELQRLRQSVATPLAAAIRFTGTGQISDPRALAARMSARFAERGGLRCYDHITRLERRQGRTLARTSQGARLEADRLLVCAGVRSAALLEGLGIRAPLVAERGYHLEWSRHAWPALPPVVFEDRSIILTRFTRSLRLCGVLEFALPDTPPSTARWRRLAQHAKALGLPVEGEPSKWTGARPTLPDYLPALGRSHDHPDLYYAFGHQHLGLTLAAPSAEIMANLVCEEPGAVDLGPFDLERFADRPSERTARLLPATAAALPSCPSDHP